MSTEDNNAEKNTAAKDESATLGLLQQIVDILQTSTIVEERGKDMRSRFWAAYKKVSGEHDDNMFERCNDNMNILLTFAGLFSAANTAFIIAMQPNPVDTTNALLVQLIQITLYGPSAAQPTTLSSSTNYFPIFWTQALSYMSLALSLLAAFGAVMGKQWLNYYKTCRYGGGSLEERCKRRHSKFQGLETWCFEGVLQSFADLLKASLFLFGLALGGWMWTQQGTISILMISTTAFGFICYAVTILVSLIRPDCPFQTRLSLAIRAVLYPNIEREEDSTASAMEWMLKTSTNPDAVSAAVELMPHTSPPPNLPPATVYEVRDKFKRCFNEEGDIMVQSDAPAYGRLLIQSSWNDTRARAILHESTVTGWNFWKSWHTLYVAPELEELKRCRQMAGNPAQQLHCQADIRSALHMILPAGNDSFTRSSLDDERSMWDGTFGLELDLPDARWLMESAEQFLETQDFEAAGNALFFISGALKKSVAYSQPDITRFLNSSDQSRKLRHSALRAACRALHYKLECNSPCDPLFSEAALTAICPRIQSRHNRDDDDDDQFINAIQLLKYDKWPCDHDLAASPLLDIQRLVLLVLPAPSPDSPAKYTLYCDALSHFICAEFAESLEPVESADERYDSRCVALRVACNIRQGLAAITADGVDAPLLGKALSQLSQALLTVCHRDSLDADSNFYYFRLIFALASRPYWLPRSEEDGHIKRCIGLIPNFCDQPPSCLFYLAGFFLRIQHAYPHWTPLTELHIITSKQWWHLIRMAWCVASRPYDQSRGCYSSDVLDDGIGILEALVTATKTHLPQGALGSELEVLHKLLGDTVNRLESRQGVGEGIVLAVRGLEAEVYLRLNTEG